MPVNMIHPISGAYQSDLSRPTWGKKISQAPVVTPPTRRSKREAVKVEPKTVRTAIYSRVSTDFESQDSSIENQQAHFLSLIEANPTWCLVDSYIEKGASGTKTEKRPELQRLLSDCRAGYIDQILTKSISRFARNTSDCLSMVRMLKNLNVTIWFEKENIRTDRMESELMLTLLAAFAQDESRSISSNMKWGIRRRFETGTYIASVSPYGYMHDGEKYVIDPDEADVVRRIFSMAADGESPGAIASALNADGVPTSYQRRHPETAFSLCAESGEEGVVRPRRWCWNTILYILQNPFYVGDALYQKYYVDEHYIERKNNGQKDMFLHADNHPTLVERALFEKVQAGLAQQQGGTRGRRTVYTGRIVCSTCSRIMRMRHSDQRPEFLCACHRRVFAAELQNVFTTVLNKLAFAASHDVPVLKEDDPLRAVLQQRGIREEFTSEDEELFAEYVTAVEVGEELLFRFKNGLALAEKISVRG